MNQKQLVMAFAWHVVCSQFYIGMEASAIGQFASGDQAAKARWRLINEGFDDEQIEILLPDYEVRSTEFGISRPRDLLGAVVLGAATGSLMGLLVAAFVFILPGMVLEENQTLAVILGTFFCVLLAGLAGALTGMRLSKKVARRFFENVGSRGILLHVQTDDKDVFEKARRSMLRSGSNWVALTSENPSWKQILSQWEAIDLKTFKQIRGAAH